MNARSTSRQGRIALAVTVLIAVVVVGSIVAVSRNGRQNDSNLAVLPHKVERRHFQAFVTEPGDVASSSNVEVRCKVKSRGTAGTAILKIIDEGEFVEKDDFLLQFDDSVLQQEMLAQNIVAANDKAMLIQAKSDLDNAQRTLREFDQGLYQQELELLESEVFVAEEQLRRSETILAHSERLSSLGLITALHLKADQFAVKKAKKDVAAFRRKVDVYKRFTRDKMIGEYDAEIRKQEANVEAATFTLELSRQKLADLKQQIEFCLVKAPSAGQVVYANDRWRSDVPQVIEEGTLIRENQIVIRLPDIRQMQVDVKINESDVNRIRAGQPVEIELDADPENVLQGTVKEVAAYPYPMRWHGSPLEYGAEITILDPPPTIRPGLRAKVKIIYEAKTNVLQVPLAAVIEHGDRHYCLRRDNNGWNPHAIRIGSNNNMHVIVEEGLSEGDQVSLTPFRHIERSDLPEFKADESMAGGAPPEKSDYSQSRAPSGPAS